MFAVFFLLSCVNAKHLETVSPVTDIPVTSQVEHAGSGETFEAHDSDHHGSGADGSDADGSDADGSDAHGSDQHEEEGHIMEAAETWICPMHPDLYHRFSGSCPICGMDLVKMGEETEGEDHMGHMMRVRDELKATLGEAYDQPVAGLAEADKKEGASTYRRSCEPCHGSGGTGDGPLAGSIGTPPADHTDPHHARFYSDAGRIEIIRNGIEGTPMVGFDSSLSDAELLNLYAFVAGLRGDEPTGEVTHPKPGTDSKSSGHDHSTHEH